MTTSNAIRAVTVSAKKTMLMRPCRRNLPSARARSEASSSNVTAPTATFRPRMTFGPLSTVCTTDPFLAVPARRQPHGRWRPGEGKGERRPLAPRAAASPATTPGGGRPAGVCFNNAGRRRVERAASAPAGGGGPAVDDRFTKLEQAAPLSGLLGWLNFSDGRPDPRWQKQLNDAYAFLADDGEPAPWQALLDALTAGLHKLHGSAAAFRDVRQAEAALALAAKVLPAYRTHHADLLAHLDDRDLFTPFFLVRVFEAVLAQGVPRQGRGPGRRRRPAPPQRLRRPSARRRAGDAAAGRTLRPRTPSPRAAPHPRRRYGLGPLSRPRQHGFGDPESDRSVAAGGGRVRPGPAGRAGGGRAGLRPRPSGQPPAQLRLRRMGPAPHRQPGPLPPLRRPQDHARRPARPRRAAGAAGPRRAAVGGGGRAGRRDPDGVRRQRLGAVGARLGHDAGRAAAAYRALSGCLL